MEGQSKTTHRGYERFFPMTATETKATTGSAGLLAAYREVLREGNLSKLPPLGNTVRGWKLRWFKLVIVINDESLRNGPIILEYYDKQGSKIPKGKILLSNATQISEVEEVDSKLIKSKKKQAALFKIVTPERTYALQASSAEERTAWLSTLSETLGLNAPLVPAPRSGMAAHDRGGISDFTVTCLSEALPVTEAVLRVGDRVVGLHEHGAAGVKPQPVASWYLTDFKGYGYVKQVVWFEAGPDSTAPGLACFVSGSAEQIWSLVSQHVRSIGWNDSDIKFSRSTNMSWESIDAPNATGTTDTRVTLEVFGKTVVKSDLEPAGCVLQRQRALRACVVSYLRQRSHLPRGLRVQVCHCSRELRRPATQRNRCHRWGHTRGCPLPGISAGALGRVRWPELVPAGESVMRPGAHAWSAEGLAWGFGRRDV